MEQGWFINPKRGSAAAKRKMAKVRSFKNVKRGKRKAKQRSSRRTPRASIRLGLEKRPRIVIKGRKRASLRKGSPLKGFKINKRRRVISMANPRRKRRRSQRRNPIAVNKRRRYSGMRRNPEAGTIVTQSMWALGGFTANKLLSSFLPLALSSQGGITRILFKSLTAVGTAFLLSKIGPSRVFMPVFLGAMADPITDLYGQFIAPSIPGLGTYNNRRALAAPNKLGSYSGDRRYMVAS